MRMKTIRVFIWRDHSSATIFDITVSRSSRNVLWYLQIWGCRGHLVQVFSVFFSQYFLWLAALFGTVHGIIFIRFARFLLCMSDFLSVVWIWSLVFFLLSYYSNFVCWSLSRLNKQRNIWSLVWTSKIKPISSFKPGLAYSNCLGKLSSYVWKRRKGEMLFSLHSIFSLYKWGSKGNFVFLYSMEK